MDKLDRAIIVRQPWIELILNGTKTWEMRGAKTNIRGRIGLIEQGTGLIVGETKIIDSLEVLSWCEINENMHFDKHRIPDEKIHLLHKWPFPWVLSNTIRYDEPIPYQHPRGAVNWVRL